MTRPLTPDENNVLDRLRDKIGDIVRAGTLPRLQQTGLLGDPVTNLNDYVDFHQKFTQLSAQLQNLRGRDKIKINPDLDPAMDVNTITPADPANVCMELEQKLVGATYPMTLPHRAFTLLHELTHTIYEPPDYPVKDFTYRKSWAQGYLPGSIGWRNADTYAEAAAQIAEEREGTPGRHRERGRIHAQREALKTTGLILGPALAWADMKINRAWLRSTDYDAFAKITVGSLKWAETKANWRSSDPERRALLDIEDDLRDNKKIIGTRYTYGLSYGLDARDHAMAANIRAYMTSLKHAVSGLKLALKDGGAITYDAQMKVLDVPRAVVKGESSALGEKIVDELVVALPSTDSQVNAHKRTIVDLLFRKDRPYECGHMQTVLRHFQNITSAAEPTPADWASATVGQSLARVQGVAESLKAARCDAVLAAASTHPEEQKELKLLDAVLRPDVDEAINIGRQLGTNLTSDQTQTRKNNFRAIHDALVAIQNEVRLVDTSNRAYEPLITQVVPLFQ